MFDRELYKQLREYHGPFIAFTNAVHPVPFYSAAVLFGVITALLL